MKAVLLALTLTGCAVCHVPPKPAVPPGVEATAFLDQRECWTLDIPEPVVRIVAETVIGVLRVLASE